jgi:hypothetical protein
LFISVRKSVRKGGILMALCIALQEARKMVGKPKKAAAEKPKDREEKKEKTLPPPPPEEVEMRVYMHCKGCAKKVKKILRRFDGNAGIANKMT